MNAPSTLSPFAMSEARDSGIEQSRLATRIAHAKAEWEATVDAVSAPIALLDHADIVVRCNRALGRLAGRDLRKCLGRRWADLFPGLPLPMPGDLPLEWTHPPSGRTFFLTNRSVETSDGDADPKKVVAMMDISAQRRKEVEVMARVDRWATLGALAMTTAHEINNPLAGLRLQANNLETLIPPYLEDPPGGASDGPPDRANLRRQVSECLSGILSASERIGAIVDELRRFGRPQDAPAKPVDVREVVKSALMLLGPKLKNIRVTTNLAAELTPIMANPIKVEQVLINLISNAADAFDENGGRERRDLSISAVDRRGGVTLEVADTAGGIPPDVADKIFKTYVSTKPVERGTGLGLMITRANVQALGGEITFTTQPERGTTFTIFLPRSEVPNQESAHDRTDSHR